MNKKQYKNVKKVENMETINRLMEENSIDELSVAQILSNHPNKPRIPKSVEEKLKNAYKALIFGKRVP